MPLLLVDALDDTSPWQALAADGVTPSTALSITDDPAQGRPGGDGASALVTASTAAQGHLLRRALGGALDLSTFAELRIWLAGGRPADGTPQRPFYLELRLASAAVPLGAPGNTWQRYLPVLPGGWASARLSLDDLPAGIRGALTVLQLRCADASASFDCHLDDLAAVREEMIGDVDAALLALLDGALTLAGQPVKAVLHPGNGPLNQPRPYIEITHYDTVFMRERTQSVRTRGDFSDQGYRVRPQSDAYELYYVVTAVADDRLSQRRMLETILTALPSRGELWVNGEPLPMETVTVAPIDQLGGFRTDQLPLFYRISTRRDAGGGDWVRPARAVSVDGDVGPAP